MLGDFLLRGCLSTLLKLIFYVIGCALSSEYTKNATVLLGLIIRSLCLHRHSKQEKLTLVVLYNICIFLFRTDYMSKIKAFRDWLFEDVLLGNERYLSRLSNVYK